MRVLVVDDDADLAEGVARGLRRKAMAVDIAGDGDEALLKCSVNAYDVVVLDRDLPGVPGDEVCRALVAAATSPRIIMLTASGALEERVEGLGLGADDYLSKPFAMVELEARVLALARRPGAATPPVIDLHGITLDPAGFVAAREGRALRLTKKEFMVLRTLLEASPKVVSAEELLEKVWDEHADPFTNAPRITIMTLRRKLGDPPVIETVVGVGYRIP
jgi:DNA-binding response OmpR family regulator